MELYPAIDIRAGRVVRVRRGDPSSETVYHPDPLAVAEGYAREGARWIHVVDLDRVFGTGDQTALIADLVRRVPVSWQMGGSVTAAAEAERLVASGLARVIVRAGLRNGPALLEELAPRIGGARLALARVVADPPVRSTGDAQALGRAEAEAAAASAAAAGVRTVVYTDLDLEGRLGGTDVRGAAALARKLGVDVVVSGGVHSLEEIARIRDAGLAGAVVGRALFEKRFTLKQALACSSR